jgi:DNA-nicking Smr family endonuclease
MRGVGTLGGPRRIVATRERESGARQAADEDAEVEAALADLVGGSGEFDLSDTSEFVEGAAHGLDPHLLRRLRAGDYAVQATLDLHGLTRDEARKAVATFIDRERSAHRRSVLIIHGRGLHSKDHIPVLKDEIKVWLARGRTGRGVLAFCSARPCDGGVGALYVLMRKLQR